MPDKALILVDIQNDFCPGGALAVPHGNEIIDVANRIIPLFDLVVATQDWHPLNHGSFAENHPGKKIGDITTLHGLPQILWPVHCVQNTQGAQFALGLLTGEIDEIILKGQDPAVDSYSGFFDNGRRTATGLHQFLQRQAVREVHIMGLATDYCVKFTALDARSLGYATHVIPIGCRAVNLKPGDDAKAFEEMKKSGVIVADKI